MRRTALRAGLAAVCVVAFVAAAAADAPSPGGPAQPRPAPQSSTPEPPASQSPAGSPPGNAAVTPPGPAQPSPPPEPKPEPPPAPPASNPQAAPSAQGPAQTAPTPPPSTGNAPPPSPPASKPPPAPPPTKSVLDKHLILGILGKEVKSAKGEDMGRVVDVIVDWTGQTRAAIIDFGGFLGVGSRRIAVAWSALHFEPEQKGDQITLDLTRDQVRAAPEYREGQPVVVLGPSGAPEPIPYE